MSLTFLAPSAPAPQVGMPNSRTAPAPGLAASGPSAAGAARAGAVGVGLGLALAAARRAAARRVQRHAAGLRQVIEWQVEPCPLVPGSEKALQTMVGSDVETGEGPWDPMGFSKLFDRNFEFNEVMTYPHVQWLRESEIKHGRVAMLAFVGCWVQSFAHIPGLPAEGLNPLEALKACYADKTAVLGIVQISLFTMIVEGKWYPENSWVGQMDREPGDLGFDPLKFSKKDGFDLKEAQLKELKNGRLAMIGMASLAAQYLVPGSVPVLSMPALPRDDLPAGTTAFCGSSTASAGRSARTAAKYTVEKILPNFQWIKAGVKTKDINNSELKARVVAGNDVLIGKSATGSLFAVGNLCPHLGTPMSEGADVIGDIIVCPLHGSSFSTKTGELIDWCPSPPILGPLTGLVIEKKNLPIIQARTGFFSDDIEVLVDTKAKKAYEADYWKGILDAQGKNDGTYY